MSCCDKIQAVSNRAYLYEGLYNKAEVSVVVRSASWNPEDLAESQAAGIPTICVTARSSQLRA